MNTNVRTTLVTGASSGIGAAFAERIARDGNDLVLVARRQDRLDLLAEALEAAHGIRASVIALDLTEPDAVAALLDELEDRRIEVTSLVNGAGFGVHGEVVHAPLNRLLAMVQLNVSALVGITRALLPSLLRAGDGYLINIASNAGYQPVPGMATYAATKSFVLSFTEALWHETRGTGVQVLSVAPGPTRTEFFEMVGTMEVPGGRLQSPERVVDRSFRALARRNPPPSILTVPGLAFQVFGERFLPRRMVISIASGATTGATA